MSLDISVIERLLRNGQYELLVSHLAEAKHPIIDVLKLSLENNSKQQLPSNLTIEHIQFSDNDILHMVEEMRKTKRNNTFLRVINFALGVIALLFGIYGIYSVMFEGHDNRIQYLCAIPSAIFLLYISYYLRLNY